MIPYSKVEHSFHLSTKECSLEYGIIVNSILLCMS